MSSAPSPVPATEPSSQHAASALRLTGVRVAMHFGAAVVYCIASDLLVSAMRELFADFEVEFSVVTQGAINFSELVSKFWYLLFAALVLVDAPMLFALQMMRPSRRWVASFWFWGVLFAAALSIGWIAYWMIVPVIVILERLQ